MKIRNLLLTTTAASLLLGTAGLTLWAGPNSAQATPGASIGGSNQMNQHPPCRNPQFQRSRPLQRGERLAAVAAQLGVSETDLRAALGLPEQPAQPDFAGAAAELGTSEDELRAALRDSRRGGAGPRRHRPDFAAVAEQFDVSTEALLAALGLPTEQPQRPDLETVAAELEVSESDLRNALRENFSRRGQRQSPVLEE
jgi:hypothetical protein